MGGRANLSLRRWQAPRMPLLPLAQPQPQCTAIHALPSPNQQACQSPFSIMTDAAIAASTDEAGYGRKRVLASLGWGR